MRLWLCFCLLMLSVVLAGCRTGGTFLDPAPKPATVDGTIAGIVRTAAGGTPLVSRKVTATNAESGTKFETSTGNTGGYSMKVPPGKYRVAVELRAGEALSKEPGELTIHASDIDSSRDFEVTVGRR